MRLQRGRRDILSGLQRDERAEAAAEILVAGGHHGGFHDRRVRIERGLDIAQLDAIAAALHLIVATTQEHELAVLVEGHEIARTIEPFVEVRLERIRHERPSRLLGIAPVSGRDGRPADVELADLAGCDAAAVGVEDQHVRVGARAADRQTVLSGEPPAIDMVVRAHVRLGGPVQVVELGARQQVRELLQVLHREDLAGEEHEAQSVEVARRQVGVQQQIDERRGHGVPHRDAVLLDEVRHAPREDRELLVDERHRRAGAECVVDVEDREVEV